MGQGSCAEPILLVENSQVQRSKGSSSVHKAAGHYLVTAGPWAAAWVLQWHSEELMSCLMRRQRADLWQIKERAENKSHNTE